MIFVNREVAIGSKAFTHALSESLRPEIANILDDDQMDDFNLGLLQDMISFKSLSDKQFMQIFDLITSKNDIDKEWQAMLLDKMQQDPRFKKVA